MFKLEVEETASDGRPKKTWQNNVSAHMLLPVVELLTVGKSRTVSNGAIGWPKANPVCHTALNSMLKMLLLQN